RHAGAEAGVVASAAVVLRGLDIDAPSSNPGAAHRADRRAERLGRDRAAALPRGADRARLRRAVLDLEALDAPPLHGVADRTRISAVRVGAAGLSATLRAGVAAGPTAAGALGDAERVRTPSERRAERDRCAQATSGADRGGSSRAGRSHGKIPAETTTNT